MSGDLISRKETERILRAYTDDVGCNRGEYEMANGILKAACCINKPENVPNAYDVEEVIHQLEELISSYESCVQTCIKEVDKKYQYVSTFEICSLHNNRGYLNGLKKALEIVKSGGTAVGQKGERE